MTQTHSVEIVIKELFTKMGLSLSSVTLHQLGPQTIYSIQTTDAQLLLADDRATRALTTIVRDMASTGPDQQFNIDINGHLVRHIEQLQKQAQLLAERARTLGSDIEMPPMSSYDRMIVHEALKEEIGVTTESRGEGHLRHIVVQPVAQKN